MQAVARSLAYFRQAIDAQPTYAPAYVGLADSYNRLAIQHQRPPRDVYPLAKAALVKALELDETLAEAHILLGVVKFRFDWEWQAADRELKRGLELEPNSSRAYLAYGMYSAVTGRMEEFLRSYTKYRDLDPLSPFASMNLAWALYHNRRYDEAIALLHKTMDLGPDMASSYMQLAENYLAKEMYADAVATCQKALPLGADDLTVLRRCARVYALSGRRGDALSMFERLAGLSRQSYVDSYAVAAVAAIVYRERAEWDQVHDWLGRAHNERSANLCQLTFDPAFDGMRSDVRFQDLLRRMNFPN